MAAIIGSERANDLGDFEKRIINFIAEHGRINTSQAMHFLPKPRWGTAYNKLQKMVKDQLILHVARSIRDSKGYYTMKPATDEGKKAKRKR